LVICTKVREGDKRIVSVKEGEIKNRHVFIIDDLVKTGIARIVSVIALKRSANSFSLSLPLPGGTLIECKNGLYRLGAAKVSAFVTHAVFPLESWKRFTQVPSLLISRWH
jgi:phosphoribosylpyrophosphate synthetase